MIQIRVWVQHSPHNLEPLETCGRVLQKERQKKGKEDQGAAHSRSLDVLICLGNKGALWDR